VRIEETLTIEAPAAAVWGFLTDPERVAAALPGAEIREKVDETTYKGGMSVRVGPLSATYKGTVSFALDETDKSAVVHARGQAMAGMGSAEMHMTSRLREVSADRTEVGVGAELKISGVLSQFGRGMIEQVSKKIFQEFSAAMKKELERDE